MLSEHPWEWHMNSFNLYYISISINHLFYEASVPLFSASQGHYHLVLFFLWLWSVTDLFCLFGLDWKSGMSVPTDIAIAYLIQGSFYGHSIYATVYMDAWRKDSLVMVVHHFITLALITFSYAFRSGQFTGFVKTVILHPVLVSIVTTITTCILKNKRHKESTQMICH